jgi:hypothetical protein
LTESTGAASDEERQRLTAVRNILLNLHKALLDSERTSYEITHGTIASPAAFLQLLINDPAFSWLKPITSLIVAIDEALAAKKPPATSQTLQQLTDDMRALLSPSREENGFWKRYAAVIGRDPAVAILHDELRQALA